MSREKNIEIMNTYYQTLGDSDYEAFADLFSEDVLYNVSGSTEISGQWKGKEALFGYLNPYVFKHIDAENSNMSTKYKIMCADDFRVVSINEADGKSMEGNAYPQRYCVILTIKDGLISDAHEFFDTALAETALFGAKIKKRKTISKADKAFDF
ncbi:nuclear transport factor 2 family protein [Hyphomicrobiales bacterium]|nr:nuclear transport factor 2 family protein [Hyphomicrobiales bacterium]